MAKVAFTKLGLSKNTDIKTIQHNGQEIEVMQYLPVNEKLALISRIINLSADDNNFANPIKVSVFTVIELIDAYTNINFTEKQKEDPCKLYDLLVGKGLSSLIFSNIPVVELNEILTGIEDSIKAFYDYRNSIMGILDIMSTDYSNLDFNANEIQAKIADPKNLELIKEIMTKLG